MGISVNSDTMRQNKLMSIQLMSNENSSFKSNKPKKTSNRKHKKKQIKHKELKSTDKPSLKIGNVYFNKYLRMHLLMNINIDSWSRPWLINGIARSLRTQDIRFSVHKDEGIADKYSYVSLLCRCDEYDIKQIKQTFELIFINKELEKCVAESLGMPNVKIICASCVSYRDYKYLYSKEFLRWVSNSLPHAFDVEVDI